MEVAARSIGGKINRLSHDLLVVPCSGIGEHAYQFLGLGGGIHQKCAALQRAQHVHVALHQHPLTEVGVFLRHKAVGVSRGEMLIVQHPDLHITLLALGQDNIHIRPPIGASKVGVGTGLHAKGAASAIINALHLSGNTVTGGAVLPVEREHIVVFLGMENIVQAVLTHGEPPIFSLPLL